ncbi:hypothetical protein NFI96_023828 [Prochilodus magdalenae]|nr:hypothetical protein NFI96_023828 [Prochilodus magdalenae]
MTDRRSAGSRSTSENNNETWSRVSKLSQSKFKANKYNKGRKQSQSPSLGTSLYYGKEPSAVMQIFGVQPDTVNSRHANNNCCLIFYQTLKPRNVNQGTDLMAAALEIHQARLKLCRTSFGILLLRPQCGMASLLLALFHLGKGTREGVRAVEISDLVNRIAPKVSSDSVMMPAHSVHSIRIRLYCLMWKDEKPVDRDLVLQWIGDSAVPCTPEIQQPRVRRISARRQSNNVEDLMKLAKQFDINMTRQDEERQLENKGRATEGQNKPESSTTNHSVLDVIEPSSGKHVPVPAKPEGLSHEEELHALFDGPTQHISGRLSPSSLSGSQESRNEPTALKAKRPDSADSKNIHEEAARISKSDLDDDWENDDLLNDSFVLEMTQNPDLLCLGPKSGSGQTGSDTCRTRVPVNVGGSFGSGSRASCSPVLLGSDSNRCSRILSKAQNATPSTFRPQPNAIVNTGFVQQLLKAGPSKTAKSENHQAQGQTSCYKRQVVTTVDLDRTKREIKGGGGVGAKNSDSLAGASGKSLDSLWGDGDDDDLLCQACDDVERISASQEQQKQTDCIDKSDRLTKAPSSVDATCLLDTNANSKTAQPGQPSDTRQASRVFGRSHSIPGASNAFGNKQNLDETSLTSHNPKLGSQYRFTRVTNISGAVLNPQWTAGALQEVSRHGPSAGSSSISHHSTFKRHQSDPVALGNKVFVAAQPVVKCTAAEIERKKQEAIARRRLRLQASQKPGAPT